MSVSAYVQIASAYFHATNIAWDMKARFDMAGFDPFKVLSLAVLSRLPVTKRGAASAPKSEPAFWRVPCCPPKDVSVN
ncbi:MAG: hypothetical protein P1U83_09235 [Roseovarius sp.]|nr:hypothetical protein [Roseovarius sp.]